MILSGIPGLVICNLVQKDIVISTVKDNQFLGKWRQDYESDGLQYDGDKIPYRVDNSNDAYGGKDTG
ncbi:hypothetical protein A3842_24945 [Paenibacillus sp. P3E]|nr:hypothetical protein A3842_24945 [Paenibacillus sp. P3E]